MLTLFFNLLAVTIAAHAQLQTERVPEPGAFEVRGEFSYLTTTANFPSSGGSTSLGGGGKYTKMEGLGQFALDFTENARVYGGFSGAQAEANSINNLASVTTIVTSNRTNAGFNEVWAGGQWWWMPGDWDIVPQVDVVYPLWRVDQNSNDPLLGEGALRAQVGSWVRYNFDNFIPYGYLGYAYRDENRSALLPYAVGLLYTQPKSFWIKGEFHGYESMSSDGNTANRGLRELYLTRANGGSFQYYSINPSVGEIALTGGIQFGNLGVYLTAATTVMGHSAADSLSGMAGVIFNGSLLGSAPREDRYFESKPDKYDEKLFQEKYPPATPPPRGPEPDPTIPGVQRKAPAPRPPKPAARKAPQQDNTLPSVELLMKETEKTLDKKVPPKKRSGRAE